MADRYTLDASAFPSGVDTADLYAAVGLAKLVAVVHEPADADAGTPERVHFETDGTWTPANRSAIDAVAAAHPGPPTPAQRRARRLARLKAEIDAIP